MTNLSHPELIQKIQHQRNDRDHLRLVSLLAIEVENEEVVPGIEDEEEAYRDPRVQLFAEAFVATEITTTTTTIGKIRIKQRQPEKMLK